MHCSAHQDREAVAICSRCGRAVCSYCAISVGPATVCRDCLAAQPPLASAKSVDTAFILELVPGLFGLLGIGYLYAGRTNEGVLRLLAWLAYLAIAGVTIAVLSTVLVGFFCLPAQLVIQVGVPIWSALTLKKEMSPRS